MYQFTSHHAIESREMNESLIVLAQSCQTIRSRGLAKTACREPGGLDRASPSTLVTETGMSAARLSRCTRGPPSLSPSLPPPARYRPACSSTSLCRLRFMSREAPHPASGVGASLSPVGILALTRSSLRDRYGTRITHSAVRRLRWTDAPLAPAGGVLVAAPSSTHGHRRAT